MSILTQIFKWLYTQILRHYPQDFQVKFGTEMQAVFTERLANCTGFDSSIPVFLLEVRDLPCAMLQ